MSVIATSSIATAVSLVCVVLLAKSDDKRHRRGGRGWPLSSGVRRCLAGLCLMPGLVLMFTGYATSLLVWLGAITVLGWLAALLPRRVL